MAPYSPQPHQVSHLRAVVACWYKASEAAMHDEQCCACRAAAHGSLTGGSRMSQTQCLRHLLRSASPPSLQTASSKGLHAMHPDRGTLLIETPLQHCSAAVGWHAAHQVRQLMAGREAKQLHIQSIKDEQSSGGQRHTISCNLQLWCRVKAVSPDMPLITAASSASCRDSGECHRPE